MIHVNLETLTDSLIDECRDIVYANHKESGQFDKLKIDWNMYLQTPGFVAIVMRDVDTIVGILFFITGPFPHNTDWIAAQQVTYYILPKYRKHSKEMMSYSENLFRIHNVDLIIQSARIGTGFCKTLEHEGYEAQDITYTKRLN